MSEDLGNFSALKQVRLTSSRPGSKAVILGSRQGYVWIWLWNLIFPYFWDTCVRLTVSSAYPNCLSACLFACKLYTQIYTKRICCSIIKLLVRRIAELLPGSPWSNLTTFLKCYLIIHMWNPKVNFNLDLHLWIQIQTNKTRCHPSQQVIFHSSCNFALFLNAQKSLSHSTMKFCEPSQQQQVACRSSSWTKKQLCDRFKLLNYSRNWEKQLYLFFQTLCCVRG